MAISNGSCSSSLHTQGIIMDKTSLGDRMKKYEAVTKNRLTNRTPVIIRLDGKAFHTWTKKLKYCKAEEDPFNEGMHVMMLETTKFIMRQVQNARIAYTQSDEISILLNDWGKLTTGQWFDNNVQKMVSVSASAASAAFNMMAAQYIDDFGDLAMFDARIFNLPKEEVNNYFLWRQQDATRNSINMLGQHHFSHRELQGKNVSQVQDMLMLSENEDGQPLNVNWNDLTVWKKRGSCVVKANKFSSREIWTEDGNIPIFSQDTNYIEQHLITEE